jgi:hypothetical protein
MIKHPLHSRFVMIRFPLHRGVSWSSILYTGGVMIKHPLHRGFVMIRCPLHRGCHDQVSSTQGVSWSGVLYTWRCHDRVSSTQGVSWSGVLYTGSVMIRHPLHRGCHDQASSTQGVSWSGILYIGGVMIRHPLHRGCHDQVSSTSFPAAASDPLNVVILTCFESMSRDRFFHELYGIVYSSPRVVLSNTAHFL